MNKERDIKELAYCGIFGAAALLLPMIFHILHLGHIFMPMYLPLIALAFFVGPKPASITSFILPILSGVATGMPPFFPPVALFMSFELSIMTAIISFINTKFTKINEWAILIPVLILGRIMYVAMVYIFSLFIKLPAAFMAGVSFVSGWPGLVLILIVVPPFVRITHKKSFSSEISK